MFAGVGGDQITKNMAFSENNINSIVNVATNAIGSMSNQANQNTNQYENYSQHNQSNQSPFIHNSDSMNSENINNNNSNKLLNIVNVKNTGVSFGMFNGIENSNEILGLLNSGIVGFLLIMMMRSRCHSSRLPLAMIISGACGNIIDRLQHGGVRDFIDFNFAGMHFPAFNVADALVSSGAAIMAFQAIKPMIFKNKV
jgi:lipoprotein signal peptidase